MLEKMGIFIDNIDCSDSTKFTECKWDSATDCSHSEDIVLRQRSNLIFFRSLKNSGQYVLFRFNIIIVDVQC